MSTHPRPGTVPRPGVTPRTGLAALAALLIAGTLFTLGAFLRPGPTLASCAPPLPVEEAIAAADIVFVGTVTLLANDARWVKVQVEEIWKGGDLPAVVEVRGGPEAGTFTSVDRTYELGRHLFVVRRDGGFLSDNGCSATQLWSADLAAFRPGDARTPTPSPDAPQGGFDVAAIVLPAAGIAIIAVLLIGGAWLVSRRSA